MKLLLYILTFSILSLSLTTCEDTVAMENSSQIAQISTALKKKDIQFSDQDNCSPLCTCNCCAQPVIVSKGNLSFSLNRIPLISKPSGSYKEGFLSAYDRSIWQPPRLNNKMIG